MFTSLPTAINEIMGWSWEQYQAYYHELLDRPLDEASVSSWLADWTRLIDQVSETYARLVVTTTKDTTDRSAESRYNGFLDSLYPRAQAADQKLKEKLLASGLEPAGFEIPLRKLRAEAALFRAANLPLLSEERKLGAQYDKIAGAQTVTWDGEEYTLQGLRPVYESPDRARREQAWRLAAGRQLADQPVLNALWVRLLQLRGELFRNADLPDYRAFRWQQMLRLDYAPADCVQFQQAIEAVAVPAATRVYENYRRELGVEALRPWDLDLDLYPVHQPPPAAYGDTERLRYTIEGIFRRLDPQLGEYFHIMNAEGLLDLDNRKGKAPGAYCTNFPVSGRPFIFMNAVGVAGDVRTLLHESGHAFHNFERGRLPYAQQRNPGLEFAEVASMAMELLNSPYVAASQGGFYSPSDTSRSNLAQLERILVFWPYMAVVDAFQHWVYTHHEQALDPANCDAQWLELWQRFIPGVDWSGLEEAAMTGWHRKQHIFRAPFYYVEYGLAQLGAVQVWRNALQDLPAATASYRSALALGGTATLPELYRTAGAKFAFDAGTLGDAVELVEAAIAETKAAIV